jgi:hypothetical protein
MEIQFFNSIFFWKKYFKDLLKIFFIELKEKIYYYYLKLIILYPGLCSIWLIIGINLVMMDTSFSGMYIISRMNRDPVELPVELTDMCEALSVGTFEPNPEYFYLYRIHRKIELINALIQKIKEKNPTHLNFDFTKTMVDENVSIVIRAVSDHHAQVFEILYAERFPSATKELCINFLKIEQYFRGFIQMLLSNKSVSDKFFRCLLLIVTHEFYIENRARGQYGQYNFNNALLFGETQGLITFSEGFKNYSYADLCTLEYLLRIIGFKLILYYWHMDNDIDLVGESYLILDCLNFRRFSVCINSLQFYFDKVESKPEEAVTDMDARMLYLLLIETLMKEDFFRLAMLNENFVQSEFLLIDEDLRMLLLFDDPRFYGRLGYALVIMWLKFLLYTA